MNLPIRMVSGQVYWAISTHRHNVLSDCWHTVNHLLFVLEKFSEGFRKPLISWHSPILICLWYFIYQVNYTLIANICHHKPADL